MPGLLDWIQKSDKTAGVAATDAPALVKYAKSIMAQRGTLPPPASTGQMILYTEAIKHAMKTGDFDTADFIQYSLQPEQTVSASEVKQ